MLQNEVVYLRSQLNFMHLQQRGVIETNELDAYGIASENEKITESESHIHTPSLQEWNNEMSTPNQNDNSQ